MDWNKEKVEELAQILTEYGLTEVKVISSDLRITLKKTQTAVQMPQSNRGFPTAGIQPRLSADFRRITEKKAQQDELESMKYVQRNEGAKKPAASDEMKDSSKYVTSPIAGIFYRQSQPGNPPYVEAGQKVKKGDIVCLVEAMKMINEIVANRDGIVKEFLVENEQFVECGAPLVLIEEE